MVKDETGEGSSWTSTRAEERRTYNERGNSAASMSDKATNVHQTGVDVPPGIASRQPKALTMQNTVGGMHAP